MVIKTLEQAKAAVEGFHELLDLDENAEFGSADSEPFRNFDVLLNRVVHRGKDIETYLGQENFWELFAHEDGWKEVSDKISAEARKIVEALIQAPYPVVRDFLDYYDLDYGS